MDGDAARAAMLIDLGIARRDVLSTPLEACEHGPTKAQMAQHQMERQRKIEKIKGVKNGSTIAAWNKVDTFSRDVVSEQLPQMNLGQSHRFKLSSQPSFAGADKPGDLSDLTAGGAERMSWLREKSNATVHRPSPEQFTPRSMRSSTFKIEKTRQSPTRPARPTGAHIRAPSPRASGTKVFRRGHEVTFTHLGRNGTGSVRSETNPLAPKRENIEERKNITAPNVQKDGAKYVPPRHPTTSPPPPEPTAISAASSKNLVAPGTTIDTPLGPVHLSPHHIQPEVPWNVWFVGHSGEANPVIRVQAVGYAIDPRGCNDYEAEHPDRKPVNDTAKEKLAIYINLLASLSEGHPQVAAFCKRWGSSPVVGRLEAAREKFKSMQQLKRPAETKGPKASIKDEQTRISPLVAPLLPVQNTTIPRPIVAEHKVQPDVQNAPLPLTRSQIANQSIAVKPALKSLSSASTNKVPNKAADMSQTPMASTSHSGDPTASYQKTPPTAPAGFKTGSTGGTLVASAVPRGISTQMVMNSPTQLLMKLDVNMPIDISIQITPISASLRPGQILSLQQIKSALAPHMMAMANATLSTPAEESSDEEL